MSSLTALPAGMQGNWGRAVGGAFTLIALLAVPALAVPHLGTDLLAVWPSGEDFGPSASQAVSADPLTFAAPTATLERLQSGEKERPSSSQEQLTQQTTLLLKDWKYTADGSSVDPIALFDQLTEQLYSFEFLIDLYLLDKLPSDQWLFLVFLQVAFNQQWQTMRPTAAAPSSPSA